MIGQNPDLSLTRSGDGRCPPAMIVRLAQPHGIATRLVVSSPPTTTAEGLGAHLPVSSEF